MKHLYLWLSLREITFFHIMHYTSHVSSNLMPMRGFEGILSDDKTVPILAGMSFLQEISDFGKFSQRNFTNSSIFMQF